MLASHMALGLAPVVFVALAAAAPVEKLDRDSQRWLARVRLFFLPGEEDEFRGLRDGGERKEYQRLFWARRDPTPATPENELQDAVARAWKAADDRFSAAGSIGSETGCGEVLALLGEPTEVERREVSARFDNTQAMREGSRPPESWIYKSRPTDPLPFTGGELRIGFDEWCRFTEGGRTLDELRRVAAARVARPSIDYRRGPDGRLVRLEDQLHASGPSSPVLASGKSEFPLSVEPKMMVRAAAGKTYVAGLVKIGPEGASTGDKATVRVAAQTADAGKPPGPTQEKAMRPSAEEGGGQVVSFGLPLEPGAHTVRLGVTLPDGRASVTTVDVDAPDFDAAGLGIGPLVLYPDLEGGSPPAADSAYAAFAVGKLRVEPRFGNVFHAKDALQVVAVVHGAAVDPASGKASLRAAFSILKDGKSVARGAEEDYDTPTAVASVGPIPLSTYGAGRYVVRLVATDARAQKTEARETAFEVRE
jgi:GWxTD domain-containing protein